MKVKKFLSFLLIFILVGSFAFSIPAMASASLNFSLNSYSEGTVFTGSNNVNAYFAGGTWPNGVAVEGRGPNVVLFGTPTSTGVYTAYISVVDGNSEYVVDVTITVGNGTSGSYNNNLNGNIIVATPDKPIFVPNTPSPNPPVITKSPTSETKDEGESAVFVAKADNYNFITWYLVSPDMATKYPVSMVGSYFVGVTASGYDSERLVLSNLSDALDGWMVEAEFTNGNGSTWANPAYLTVVKEIVEVTPTPTPAPTPTPTPAPTPTPTPATTTYVNGTAVQNGPSGTNSGGSTGSGFGGTTNNYNSNNTAIGNASTVNEPYSGYTMPPATTVSSGTGTGSSGTTRNNSHVGAYILAVVAGAIIIGAILIMALYMKGKINLGGLEKALDNKNNEMFDDGNAYYNPDDFKGNDSHNV